MYDFGIFITWDFPCLHLCVDYKDGCVMNDAFLAAKAELPGTLDAMLSEEWEAAGVERPIPWKAAKSFLTGAL